MRDIKVIDCEGNVVLFNYILSHGMLSRQDERGKTGSIEDNVNSFKEDFENGRLEVYRGTYAAYQKGILCGQHINREILYETASQYFGKSGLSIFRVPSYSEELEDVL